MRSGAMRESGVEKYSLKFLQVGKMDVLRIILQNEISFIFET